jgi:Spy/CpxP family protein refolding chaperone
MNGKSALAVMASLGVISGAASFGILSGVALAQPEGRRAGGRAGRVERIAEYLGLTPEQREQWKAMHEQHRKETEPLRAEGRTLHEKLRAALEAEKADPTTVGKAALAVKDHRDKMQASREAFRARLRASLSPEQALKLDAFEAARGFGRGEGHPRGGPGGPHHRPMGGPDSGLDPGPDEDDLPPPPIQN